ncbi:MAG: hypothetical protein K9J30_04190 [Bacteroidales bacterium]|nr:hypothetical protein [Bacteroidales bacterium]
MLSRELGTRLTGRQLTTELYPFSYREFLKLKKKGNSVDTFDHECDFVIKKGTKIAEAFQVCYELHDENQDREIDGILEAMQIHGLKKGLILTQNEEDEVTKNAKKIKIMPVRKWLG